MILLATAEKGVAQRWSEAIGQQGSPRVASSLDQLEGILAGRRPELLLLDLKLPGLRRIQHLPTVLELSPDTRVMVFSAVPQDEEGIEALQAGAMGYCNTHIAPELLSQAIAVVSRGEVWVGRKLIMSLIARLGVVAAGAQTNGDQPRPLSNLTEREQEIARLVGDGVNNRKIATELGITERTVKAHLGSVFDKTGATDRLQLALMVNGFAK
ncbi:MAG: response regulator transcription factor [Gammaproteobacteria bacterium]|nr:response regulator transcription factor [Gammaproteobacteria bacterium]